MRRKLSQYLRIERKRAGLSQRDVAALLGVQTASKVSRYERDRRLPLLRTALAYEAILRKPVSDLFAGTFASARDAVQARAKHLATLERRAGNPVLFRRRKESISAIANQ